MYIFSIKRDLTPIVEIVVDDTMIRENLYLQSLIEKCFEKVFQLITRDSEKDRDLEKILEEIDYEDDDE